MQKSVILQKIYKKLTKNFFSTPHYKKKNIKIPLKKLHLLKSLTPIS